MAIGFSYYWLILQDFIPVVGVAGSGHRRAWHDRRSDCGTPSRWPLMEVTRAKLSWERNRISRLNKWLIKLISADLWCVPSGNPVWCLKPASGMTFWSPCLGFEFQWFTFLEQLHHVTMNGESLLKLSGQGHQTCLPPLQGAVACWLQEGRQSDIRPFVDAVHPAFCCLMR